MSNPDRPPPEGFLADWLQLREPVDAVARSARLVRAVARRIAAGPDGPVRVLDLATGTGANIRYLAEHLPPRQEWLVVDRDPVLLGLAPARTASWAAARRYDVAMREDGCALRGERIDCRIATRQLDLGALDRPDIFAGRHLVTASALLDLASDPWLATLAARCQAAGAAVLLALTYDGRSSCTPAEPEDDRVRALFNQHQTRNKGLGGLGAGPDAAATVERRFADAGYEMQRTRSDWTLGPAQARLQRELIDGWARAASETAPGAADAIARWRGRRLAHVDAERSRVTVGHVDLAGWLPARGAAGASI